MESVPEIAESVPEIAESVPEIAESVPKIAESVPETTEISQKQPCLRHKQSIKVKILISFGKSFGGTEKY